MFEKRSEVSLGFGNLLSQGCCVCWGRGCGSDGDSGQSTEIPERNVSGEVSGSVSDDCREQLCEASIRDVWKLLQKNLCGIAASRVVFNCLHEVLGLTVFSGDLVGTGKELVHIAMDVGKGSKILSRKFGALQSLKDLVEIGLIESAILCLCVRERSIGGE